MILWEFSGSIDYQLTHCDHRWTHRRLLGQRTRIGTDDAHRMTTDGFKLQPSHLPGSWPNRQRSMQLTRFQSRQHFGSSIMDVRVRDGKRQSVFRSYTFPYMDRPNLTVLTHALVTRITLWG